MSKTRPWRGSTRMLLPALTTPLPDTALFDQLLLFPMKLGLSVWLASTAMNRQSNEMAKRLEPVARIVSANRDRVRCCQPPATDISS